eukprot:SM000002S05644  [mRNA]  locus=s2:1316738:1320337:- [translate_table: standard]
MPVRAPRPWTRATPPHPEPPRPREGGDAGLVLRASEVARRSAGEAAPHPNHGCVLALPGGAVLGEGHLRAQGTRCAEAEAVADLASRSGGGGSEAGELTAYLNLEPADSLGDYSSVTALKQAGLLQLRPPPRRHTSAIAEILQCQAALGFQEASRKAGVTRVVVGMRHPLAHQRDHGIGLLRAAGMRVDVLGEGSLQGPDAEASSGPTLSAEEAIGACLLANEPLIFRAAHKKPFSVLKYAMTLDGKIAASTGHAAWVTSTQARQRVFDTRAQSDAIIVGGNTVRRDDPRLTTRREGGHVPVRIVMSRTLRLPLDANLWDVASAPTIVMTQRGARVDFQAHLRQAGVEVVEFDFLGPAPVMEYCYQRGFLQVLWECGGTLSAPAISGGMVDKIMAFVAPKIIGGVTAPSPVGELGFVEMTQALQLSSIGFETIGPDLLVSGYLHKLPDPRAGPPLGLLEPGVSAAGGALSEAAPVVNPSSIVSFYKAWDSYGFLSNFSAHAIEMPAPSNAGGSLQLWPSVEHYYQAQKFEGVDDRAAMDAQERIHGASSPEEAARIGRALERSHRHLVRPDWEQAKLEVMYAALQCKFRMHLGLHYLLLATDGATIAEASPHDYFWGIGRTGTGSNHLGKLLMRLRAEIRESSPGRQDLEMTQHAVKA